MCGRLNVTADPLTQLLMEAFGIAAVPATNHNLAPTEPLLVVRNVASVSGINERAPNTQTVTPNLQADELRWWLTPSWSNGPSTKFAMFNAKSETLLEKRAFAQPFKNQRCVVPVTGYYEWQKGQHEKLPFYVQAQQGTGLLLAGLWDRWTDKTTGELVESCSIVTAAATQGLEFLHHRQPVFLSIDAAKSWLDQRSDVVDLGVLLQPHLGQQLRVDAVSTHVNNARHKDERCVQPIADSLLVDEETLKGAVRFDHPADSGAVGDLFDAH